MGPVSALILIIGNVGIILGLFPAHVAWTIYTLIKLVPFQKNPFKFFNNCLFLAFCRYLFIHMPMFCNCRIDRFDVPLKVAILFGLPALFGIWLGLSIAGSVLVGLGYGFFTPWVSTFEAFRHGNELKKFKHCVVVKS